MLVILCVLGVVALGVSAGLIVWMYFTQKRLDLVAGARECKIDALREGVAKVRGRIYPEHPGDLLTSPLSRTPCVYFRFDIEEQRTRTVTRTEGNRRVTRTETYWVTVLHDVQRVPCVIRDKTGDAGLDLERADMELDRTAEKSSGFLRDCPREVARRLDRDYGFSTRGIFLNRTLRYSETALTEGARVFVVGEAREDRRGFLFQKHKQPLIITDKTEEELVSALQWRWRFQLMGAIGVPVLFVVVACVAAVATRGARLAPAAPPNPGANAAGQRLIDENLALLRSPDNATRSRAAVAFAAQIPPDPARRAEVVQALQAAAAAPDPGLQARVRVALERWAR